MEESRVIGTEQAGDLPEVTQIHARLVVRRAVSAGAPARQAPEATPQGSSLDVKVYAQQPRRAQPHASVASEFN